MPDLCPEWNEWVVAWLKNEKTVGAKFALTEIKGAKEKKQ